jgi:hypothetical protein
MTEPEIFFEISRLREEVRKLDRHLVGAVSPQRRKALEGERNKVVSALNEALALAEGRARGMSDGISQVTWEAALTPAGGDVLSDDW